ncbi:MAG: hypothetical protein CBB72_007085 [Muricauda sp. TMED12]|nr:MAG: hypothetical protein CBB72_007085 [Muricauda sp. TMED12]|tara:strand:+ start:138804 stop:139550 length:747 start_codon:yes stop_codon:yes gene_type:complete
MKKIIYLTIGLLIVSCSNESATSENPIEENQVLTQKFYFDGQYYNIKYQEDLNGNLSPFGELPATLKNLDNLPELATVVENDIIYFFTNEAEKFAFYGDDYNLLLTSRKQNDLSTEKNPALVGPFNLNVKFYQDSYLNGNVMSINSIDDLKNLKSVNFNDKASSCSITGSFRFPNGSSPGYGYDTRRRVIMYEHSNFSGKSIEISNYYISAGLYGHKRFKSLSSALFSNWNDKISSIDIVQSNISQVR